MSTLVSRYAKNLTKGTKTVDVLNPFTSEIIYRVPLSDYQERVDMLKDYKRRHVLDNTNLEARLDTVENILSDIYEVK